MRSDQAGRRTVTRNPGRTRERILAAALKEFASNGLAGARVDVVASKAGVNKRMLYHYFTDKRGLFREVLRLRMSERSRWLAAAPEDPAEMASYWYERMGHDLEWIRLLEWEALEDTGQEIIAKEKRQEVVQGALERIRKGQRNGFIDKDYDAAQILLSIMALTCFPVAFPQLTRLVTGLAANSARFRQRRSRFLRDFVPAFRPRGQATALRGIPAKHLNRQKS